MFCKNCGKELADNSRFCTGCGAKQDEKTTPAVNEMPVFNSVSQQEQAYSQSVTPEKGMVNAVGQPVGVPGQTMETKVKKSKSKKLLPIIIASGSAVVAIVIAVILVFAFVPSFDFWGLIDRDEETAKVKDSNTGAKGIVSRYEEAINDYDLEKAAKCFAEYSLLNSDYEFEYLDGMLNSFEEANLQVDFEIESEKDISDDDWDYSGDQTWLEYCQEYFSNYSDDYDDDDYYDDYDDDDYYDDYDDDDYYDDYDDDDYYDDYDDDDYYDDYDDDDYYDDYDDDDYYDDYDDDDDYDDVDYSDDDDYYDYVDYSDDDYNYDFEVQEVKEVRVNISYDYDGDYEDVEDYVERFEDKNKFICVKIDGNWYIWW